MAMIRFACSCGHKLEVPPSGAGKNWHCPKCQAWVEVPEMGPDGTLVSPSQRPCPKCGKSIARLAKLCKYCRQEVAPGQNVCLVCSTPLPPYKNACPKCGPIEKQCAPKRCANCGAEFEGRHALCQECVRVSSTGKAPEGAIEAEEGQVIVRMESSLALPQVCVGCCKPATELVARDVVCKRRELSGVDYKNNRRRSWTIREVEKRRFMIPTCGKCSDRRNLAIDVGGWRDWRVLFTFANPKYQDLFIHENSPLRERYFWVPVVFRGEA